MTTRGEYIPGAERVRNGAATGHRPVATTAIHRTLPHSVEAEQGVLGSMIIGGRETIEECSARLELSYFYVPAHQTIFGLLLAAHASGIPTDLITFTQALRDDQPHGSAVGSSLDAVGGASYVTSLFTVVPTAANVIYYAEILREKYVLRQMIATFTEGVRRAYEEQDEVNALLEEMTTKTIDIGQMANWRDEFLKPARDFVDGAVAEIKATYYNRGKPIGLTSGLPDLDRMIGGFQAPLPYCIAGRPAMGKSALIEIGEHLAIENAAQGINVAVFSVEMTGRQLIKRALCRRAEINLQRLRDGFLAKDTLPKLEKAAEIVRAGNLWIDETSSLSIAKFRARARHAVLKRKCQLIIIDYLQRMSSTSKRAQGNREQEINEIAEGIAATAKELNIPIIVLAQLNRESEKRPDKTPQLSDLRESGSIEEKFRVVLLLHRPVYYTLTEAAKIREARKLKIFKMERSRTDGEWHPILDENQEPTVDLEAFEEFAVMNVAKQNDGPTGEIRLRFVKEFARFESVTTKLFSNNPEERQK